jgi:hypothetical protein
VAPGTKHAVRGVPADVRVPLALGEGNAAPFGAPHGVGRPAGSRFRLTARFQQLRWAWPSPGSERIAWSRCAPGRIPEPLGPRACKARRRKRRTPLRLQMPLEAPSSERGCRNTCLGNFIGASGEQVSFCELRGVAQCDPPQVGLGRLAHSYPKSGKPASAGRWPIRASEWTVPKNRLIERPRPAPGQRP